MQYILVHICITCMYDMIISMLSDSFMTFFIMKYYIVWITDRLVFPVLYELARILKEANLTFSKQEQLLSKLGFINEEKEEFKKVSKSRMYMIMLLKWEDKFGSVGVTKKLAKIFRECELWKAANIVAYEYSPPPLPQLEWYFYHWSLKPETFS